MRDLHKIINKFNKNKIDVNIFSSIACFCIIFNGMGLHYILYISSCIIYKFFFTIKNSLRKIVLIETQKMMIYHNMLASVKYIYFLYPSH